MAFRRKIKNSITVQNRHYKKVVLKEELQWYVLILIVTVTPIALCLAVLRFQHASMPF